MYLVRRDLVEAILIIRTHNQWVYGSYHPIPSLDEDRKKEEFLASSRDGMGWYDPKTLGLGVLMIDMICEGSSEATLQISLRFTLA